MQLPYELKKQEILIKQEATTDPSFGCDPNKRSANTLSTYGIVNLNKPQGPTSHQAADYVKKIVGVDKAGHSGTLDPGVTGVLPVALSRATRVVQALLPAGKEYVCLMHLHQPVPEEKLRTTIKKFTGTITQLPPLRSAVVRQLRERTIYYFDILEIKEQNILFKVGCEAGTYIRKLCHDIGRSLGIGAHMAQLIRTKAGPFNFDTTITLQDLEDAIWYWKHENNEKLLRHCIQPIETAVAHLPKIWILDSAVDTLCHGALLNAPGVAQLDSDIKQKDLVAIMTLKNELVALGQTTKNAEEIMTMTKGLIALPSTVFMLPGTYPKLVKKN